MSDFKILTDMTKETKDYDLCFAFFKGNVLVVKEEKILRIPTFNEVVKLGIQYGKAFFLGTVLEKACFGVEIISEPYKLDGLQLMPLREVAVSISEEVFLIAGRASQVLHWDETHRFCGKCGSKTHDKKDEMAKVCPNCGNLMYPVICPAIIVAVTKGDKILLAHNGGFEEGLYSLIAGFVEAGEPIESTVEREVFEEVGLKVKNITYYKSSSWAFPNSLMLGFFAEYESGEIKVDGKEIIHADWFSKDNLPTIPGKFTVARKIIDEFIRRNNI